MRRSKGFTLLELVIVVVVLALVSVTSAPRILGFFSDGRVAKLKEIEAVMKTGSDIVFSKALTQGLENQCYTYIDDIYTCNGYPTAHRDNVLRSFNIDAEQVYVTNKGSDAAGREAFIGFRKDNVWHKKCYVYYKDAVSGGSVTVASFTEDC
ncbi:prepilin-type N-terminal cleavage/methylation domain-containing protein [Vibrio harveyi]|uniref:prepilin-type N-terminal cleavage/methylation domain-containing protein n=1 Tax=Vibrio harveyi TaxID=669 RepID=UPI0005761278|nr:prepilin-type N-terminal cleavage/methylation domain-containing protein [Vibrio harveyi]MBY7701014.1 prepilin-type N-terminal cleavage/methylation domain-containing protein [Vibrio harveyi]PNM61525.1 histidine kinase [Vibrio harveyi]UIL55642.1 prepilin-type N-terminal cleavage/methylation domain-containing protein [Vibrio harveyi]SQA31274.1 signal transduction histidine kinase [Vibrio harveyi]